MEDVAWANVRAATRDGHFSGEALNIAQGHSYSLLEVKKAVEEVCGRRLDLEQRPARTGDVSHTLADITRAKVGLGYSPSTDFRGQLERMALWFQDSHPR